jgi:hypothetical protein
MVQKRVFSLHRSGRAGEQAAASIGTAVAAAAAEGGSRAVGSESRGEIYKPYRAHEDGVEGGMATKRSVLVGEAAAAGTGVREEREREDEDGQLD